MARKSAQAIRHSRPPLPFWVWLLIGFALGVLLGAGLVFRDWKSSRDGVAQANPQAEPKPVSDPGVTPQNTEFDFYTVLKEREVRIPDDELKQQSQRTDFVAAPNLRFWLQVGSFPKIEDADSMKARLALQGIQVQVAPVTVKNVQWHRVRIGPYATPTELESAKRSLIEAGVEAFAYREQVPVAP
jgi:cell division protein FtsN